MSTPKTAHTPTRMQHHPYSVAFILHACHLHEELVAALKQLRIDANRLCDRQLGGTYEDDCRRSLAVAVAVLQKAEVP